jgi:hypothetical protein
VGAHIAASEASVEAASFAVSAATVSVAATSCGMGESVASREITTSEVASPVSPSVVGIETWQPAATNHAAETSNIDAVRWNIS